MTEQQADALMERIGTLTKFIVWQKEVGFSPSFEDELELAALTALCRHRDHTLYLELWTCSLGIEPTFTNLYNMQTWEAV